MPPIPKSRSAELPWPGARAYFRENCPPELLPVWDALDSIPGVTPATGSPRGPRGRRRQSGPWCLLFRVDSLETLAIVTRIVVYGPMIVVPMGRSPWWVRVTTMGASALLDRGPLFNLYGAEDVTAEDIDLLARLLTERWEA